MNKEDQFLSRRFIDLSRQAFQKNIVVFSDFLNMYEISLLYRWEKEYAVSFSLYGGYENAERQMVSFQPDALYYEWDYPIFCLKFSPQNARFADHALSHRDVLGALMHLGMIALNWVTFCWKMIIYICFVPIPFQTLFSMNLNKFAIRK